MRLHVNAEPETTPSLDTRAFWPDAVAFREAVQNPRIALGDSELQDAEIVLDRRGLPLVYSGRFAVVFRLRSRTGDWAIRCFTQAADQAERQQRYRAVAATLAGRNGHFVPFRYIEQGIKVGAHWFPIVAMRWAQGETLGRWVDRRHADPIALRTLAATLARLLEDLEAAGIAHGDWQHDNLLVSENGDHVTLVDYDGMFVPELTGCASPEVGHPNFQHPARAAHHYAVGLDRFACLAIQTALFALARDPALWSRFSDGESLLFKRADFEAPDRSPVFAALRGLVGGERLPPRPGEEEHLRALLARMEDACASRGPDGVLLAGEPLPAAPEPPRASVSSEKWWLEEGGTTAKVATTARSAAPPRPQFVADYVSWLATEQSREAEQKNLWTMRTCGVLLPGMFGVWIASDASSFPWFFLINFLNVFSWIYGAWPSKKSRDALQKRTEELNLRIAELGEQMARKRAEALSGSPYGMNSEVGRFITAYLERIPINRMYGLLPGIGLSTVEQLRASGIHTVADLRRRIHGVTTLPNHYIARLQTWCGDLEMEAATQYRQGAAPDPQAEGDLAHLEWEKAECEAELDALARERDRFPDTSFGAYLRKVFWLD